MKKIILGFFLIGLGNKLNPWNMVCSLEGGESTTAGIHDHENFIREMIGINKGVIHCEKIDLAGKLYKKQQNNHQIEREETQF